MTVVVSKATTYFMPGGKDFESSSRAAFAALSTSQRIGVRKLLHADADCFVPAVHQVRVVVFGTHFRTANVLQLNESRSQCFSG